MKKVDSMVGINDIISQTSCQDEDDKIEQKASHLKQQALIRLCDELMSAINHVMLDAFGMEVNQIPIRFAKYFVSLLNKICSSKEIMKEVKQQEVCDLIN